MRQGTERRYVESLGKVFAAMLVLTITVPLFSHRFGNLHRLVVWAAWIQVIIHVLTVTQAATAIYTVRKRIRSGVGWVDWGMPPYPRLFRNAIGTSLASLIMVGFAFNFFGIFVIPPGAGVWTSFFVVTVIGMTCMSKTGLTVSEIYRNIDEVEKHNL